MRDGLTLLPYFGGLTIAVHQSTLLRKQKGNPNCCNPNNFGQPFFDIAI